MKFRSIKQKVLLTLLPLAIIPVILLGMAGIIYLMNVTQNNAADDNLAQAKAVALYVSDSLNSSRAYLESLASRPYLIAELARGQYSEANTTVAYARNNGKYDVVYITDQGGTVVSASPDQALRIGRNYSDRLWVASVLSTGRPFTGGPYLNLTGVPTIFMSVPVTADNGTLLGVLIGQGNPDVMADKFLHTQVKNTQFIYIVNESGVILTHNNRSYMRQVTDFSSVPVVQEVIRGRTGVMESYSPVEGEKRLDAYAPAPGTGWGIVVSLPMGVVLQPVYDSALVLAAVSIVIALAAGIIAWHLGKRLTDPIVSVSTATKKMANGVEYRQYLPMGRNDEIGELARSFEDMSRRIVTDKERITEEKNRVELYVDIMGHDINNLNQSAMTNLELIENDPGLTGEERKSIQDALTAIRGSAGIIDNVRKIQRINEEKLDVIPEDLDALIKACIRDAPRPPGKKVIFEYKPAPGSMVKGNPLLKEAICNLLGNSIKYSGDEVTIWIRVDRKDRAAGPFYELTVEDNGHGIPDDIKPKLFQRFQRGTTKAHGKGLGLYIVRSLVEKLGGSVRVEDRVPRDYSMGAKFVLELPAYEEEGR